MNFFKFLDHQGNIIIGASLTITIMIINITGHGLECHNLLLVFMEITMMLFLSLIKDIVGGPEAKQTNLQAYGCQL
jgi:hypothetical protein